MRFLVNPECYHKMCESCVDRIFSHGPAPCPVAGCARTLRKARFRTQTFEDLHVEREVDIRRRVAAVFDRREDEFTTLLAYNNYLEEVESLTFNLLNGIDVKATEAKLQAYATQNAPTVAKNAAPSTQDNANTEAQLAAQKEQARSRKEAARKDELGEKREIINRAAKSTQDRDADQIAKEGQKVVLKKSTARRTAAEKTRQQQAAKVDNGSAGLVFEIQGLKPVVQAEPEKEYDPFGGYAVKSDYYELRQQYGHPWLEKARTDAQITAGGYDVREYCARAMMEAFAGLGVFVEGEVAGREGRAVKGVATTSAAGARGEGGVGLDGDVL